MPGSVFTDAYASLVERLIELRKARGLLQSEVAARLGKPQQFVSKVENRDRRLDAIELYQYVKALDADPVELVAAVYRELG